MPGGGVGEEEGGSRVNRGERGVNGKEVGTIFFSLFFPIAFKHDLWTSYTW